MISTATLLTTLALLAGTTSALNKPFPAGAKADYQIGGAYAPPAGVQVVMRDSHAAPAAGKYNVCYVNGFQTQAGELSRWATSGAILLNKKGNKVSDPDWPGEYILDHRTEAQRNKIAAIIGQDIARCASSGFDAVEIDNLDTYASYRFGPVSKGGLTRAGAIALSQKYAAQAHSLGMAIAQKNMAEDSAVLKSSVGFNFAVAEECVYQNECTDYSAYGSSVIAIEYTDNGSTLAGICAAPNRPLSTMLRDRDVLPAGSSGYVSQRC